MAQGERTGAKAVDPPRDAPGQARDLGCGPGVEDLQEEDRRHEPVADVSRGILGRERLEEAAHGPPLE